MSARLTLLLLCDQIDAHALLISALLAAGFHLMVEPTAEDAMELLAHVPADVIMIRHDGVQDGSLVGAELKRVAPRTPIILVTGGSGYLGPQLGIDSICRADSQDETLARAVAIFFRNALTKPPRQSRMRLAEEAANVSHSGGKAQLTA